MLKRMIVCGALAASLSGCAGLAAMLAAAPTVVAIVDGVRVGCNWVLNSDDAQKLLNSGIVGLKTVDNYVGAACAAFAALPVAAAPGGVTTVAVGGLPMRATRAK